MPVKNEQLPGHHIQAERKDLHHYKITDKNITSDMQAISLSDSAAKTKSGKPKDIIQPPLPEQSAQHNKTFRQLAEKGDTIGLLKHISQHGTMIDINGTSSNGNTALHWAALRNHRAVIKTLLAAFEGIDFNVLNKNGKTAAELASCRDSAGLINIAAQQEASSNTASEGFTSPSYSVSVTRTDVTPSTTLRVLEPNFVVASSGQEIHSHRSGQLNIAVIKGRAKIVEDFAAVLPQLMPSIPPNGQVVELACGACLSALAYPLVYGDKIKFFGIDHDEWNIRESECYTERQKSIGLDFSFHLGDASKPNEHWPKRADLCVIRHPSVTLPSEMQVWHQIFNVAADLDAQLLVTTFNEYEMNTVLELINRRFTVNKRITTTGHAQWPDTGEYDSHAVLLEPKKIPL